MFGFLKRFLQNSRTIEKHTMSKMQEELIITKQEPKKSDVAVQTEHSGYRLFISSVIHDAFLEITDVARRALKRIEILEEENKKMRERKSRYEEKIQYKKSEDEKRIKDEASFETVNMRHSSSLNYKVLNRSFLEKPFKFHSHKDNIPFSGKAETLPKMPDLIKVPAEFRKRTYPFTSESYTGKHFKNNITREESETIKNECDDMDLEEQIVEKKCAQNTESSETIPLTVKQEKRKISTSIFLPSEISKLQHSFTERQKSQQDNFFGLPTLVVIVIKSQDSGTDTIVKWNCTESTKDLERYVWEYVLLAYFPSDLKNDLPAPQSIHWQRIGSMRSLQLPIECTINKTFDVKCYYLSVVARDRNNRFGNISNVCLIKTKLYSQQI
ncbi:uncharacterized protein LOC130642144 isoform X2 [Hydractinia symbiolongicarpus]|uniref:uncharacterized protein LOC130642144 isoform X2 n=1 Tax=Hydractinia symbiolongicarpus TaxID=13093 RepID=UPI00254DD03B|nr:uncharacterized protein LOC130642144 isoform X2 [Hydractinia symbiolongicarpus]